MDRNHPEWFLWEGRCTFTKYRCDNFTEVIRLLSNAEILIKLSHEIRNSWCCWEGFPSLRSIYFHDVLVQRFAHVVTELSRALTEEVD
jgi:hypothetical protein